MERYHQLFFDTEINLTSIVTDLLIFLSKLKYVFWRISIAALICVRYINILVFDIDLGDIERCFSCDVLLNKGVAM